jgi:cold-inducible RNA-binding protein
VRLGRADAPLLITARELAGVRDSMGRRLYVGNLPYKATDEELRELFSRSGPVDNVQVMRDNMTGRARGFAFVEMATDEGAQKAIADFHQYQLEGRALVVNEARPRTPGGGGRGEGSGGRGRDYGGDYGGGRREPRW